MMFSFSLTLTLPPRPTEPRPLCPFWLPSFLPNVSSSEEPETLDSGEVESRRVESRRDETRRTHDLTAAAVAKNGEEGRMTFQANFFLNLLNPSNCSPSSLLLSFWQYMKFHFSSSFFFLFRGNGRQKSRRDRLGLA